KMAEEDALYAFSMSVVCVLTTPMPEDGGENPTVKQVRKRAKWDNDDYDTLEAKYMAEDASSKKFLVSNFTNYKITYLRPVLEQYNKLLKILGRFTQHKMNMDESIQICIIDKLPPSWKDFKHALKHLKKELTLIELGSHLHIEESLRVQDSDKPKGNNVAGPSVVNMVEYNNSSRQIAQLRMNMGQDRQMQMVRARAEGNAAGPNGTQIRYYNCRGKEEARIQLQAEEYDLMAAAADLDEIKEVNANCILMANL
nr:zinc finger, CCHC-type [Tanacetum cinerariifolium]